MAGLGDRRLWKGQRAGAARLDREFGKGEHDTREDVYDDLQRIGQIAGSKPRKGTMPALPVDLHYPVFPYQRLYIRPTIQLEMYHMAPPSPASRD